MKAAFTIATANYLAQAKTVGDTLLHNNPDYTFFVALLDKADGRIDTMFFNPIQIFEIGDLNIVPFSAMVDRYSIFELSNALKPFFAEYLFNTFDEIEIIVYLDSDIVVYDSLSLIHSLMEQSGILLCPHSLTPVPMDGFYLGDNDFLNCGIYNGGFFALRRGAESKSFLAWWKERLETLCFVQFSNGLFVDQIWLNLVPVYFNKVAIVVDVGFDVAFWNFHERRISGQNGKYLVNNHSPLIFFHFSGYDFANPQLISKYQNRYSFENQSNVVPLYKDYHDKVLLNNYNEYSGLTCYYENAKSNSTKSKNFQPGIFRRLANKLKLKLGTGFLIL